MRVFITGSKGQLGTAFVKYFQAKGYEYQAVDVDTLDIADPDATADAVMAYRPGLVINCAAYNQVDLAEADDRVAVAVNAVGARNLAQAVRRLEASMVHYGTDYVFDGAKNAPYTEQDQPNPVNNYGRSKLLGEKYVLENVPTGLVLRLSWVYGEGIQNFMHKLKGWAQKPGPLRVAADEISVPTYTGDVVNATMAALERGLSGTWHLTNTGHCSRLEWAKLALKEFGIEKEIEPARMADFNLPARRPGFSAMANEAFTKELGITIPAWQESVQKFIRATK
jgi:dTDP-4-dehydrorhamnose reductase